MGFGMSIFVSMDMRVFLASQLLTISVFLLRPFSYRLRSSYPHGGWVVTGLILSSCAAMAATIWGVSSCSFVYVDYTTNRGDFSDFFTDPTADGEPVQQRVSAGLFSWLAPYDDGGSDWTDGQCVGYTESQRDHFGDTIFEVARIFAVLATLSGICTTMSLLFLACMSLGRFQILMMSAVLGFVTVFVALTFIVFQSTLCTDLASYQDQSFATNCTIDQGGLVVIAAIVFWTVAFLIFVIYVKAPEADLTLHDGQITNAFEERQQQRLYREKERRMQRTASAQRRKQQPMASASRQPEDDVATYDEGGTEVHVGRRGSESFGPGRASVRSMGSEGGSYAGGRKFRHPVSSPEVAHA